MIYGDQAYGSVCSFISGGAFTWLTAGRPQCGLAPQFPDAPAIFVDDADLVRLWNGRDRVFLFVPPDQIARVKQVIPQPPYIVAQSSGKVVYANRR